LILLELFAVDGSSNFGGHSNTGGLLSYSIHAGTGSLTAVNSVISNGSGPAYVGVDKTGPWLVAANYNGGSYGVWPINQDGSIGPPSSLRKDTGKGLAPDRQDGPHPHQFVIDPSNRFAIIPDLGIDKYMMYSLNEQSGTLTPNAVAPFFQLAPGSGPRHMSFHPTLSVAYGINELAATIVTLSFNAADGTFSLRQTISTIPGSANYKVITASEVRVSQDGQFLYASTRYLNGTNGIFSIYKIAPSDGTLTLLGYRSTEGLVPWFFMLDDTGIFILVTNQGSNTVNVFKRDITSGLIIAKVAEASAAAPTCIVVL